jgi:TonB-dependent receptor
VPPQQSQAQSSPSKQETHPHPTPSTAAGRLPVASVELGYADLDIVSRTRLGIGGFDWKPDERQTLSGRVSYSRATYDETLDYFKYNSTIVRSAPGTAKVRTVPIAANGFTYDTSGFNQSFAILPAAYNNLATYSLSYWRPDGRRNINDKIWPGRLDYAFNQGAGDRGIGFALGGTYTQDSFGFAINRTQLVPNTRAPALGLADAAGLLNAPLRYNGSGLQLLTIDPVKALAQLQALPAGSLNQTDTRAFNAQDNFGHEEKMGAGYAAVSFRSDRLDARAGVRYDSTRQITDSTVLASGAFRPLRTRSSYDFLLPSALVTWHATPTIDLCGAFSQTIGRPGYDAYAARSSISFAQESDLGNGNAQNVSVSICNPDIRHAARPITTSPPTGSSRGTSTASCRLRCSTRRSPTKCSPNSRSAIPRPTAPAIATPPSAARPTPANRLCAALS